MLACFLETEFVMNNKPSLRYATFKVRKFKWLFYKINTCLPKTTTCIGLLAEQIFLVNGYCNSFPMSFPKAPASCCKIILNYVLQYCTSILLSSKSVSQILNSYFKLEILIFLFFDEEPFLVYMFN